MNIKKVMTANPACCSPDTTLDQIAKLMLEHNCGEIPVCEGSRLVGVITDRDLACRGFTKAKNPLDVTAREVMTTHLFTIGEHADVEEALKVMQQQHVRRLPVLHDGRIVGIVSIADLVPELPQSKVAKLVTEVSQPATEAAIPAP